MSGNETREEGLDLIRGALEDRGAKCEMGKIEGAGEVILADFPNTSEKLGAYWAVLVDTKGDTTSGSDFGIDISKTEKLEEYCKKNYKIPMIAYVIFDDYIVLKLDRLKWLVKTKGYDAFTKGEGGKKSEPNYRFNKDHIRDRDHSAFFAFSTYYPDK